MLANSWNVCGYLIFILNALFYLKHFIDINFKKMISPAVNIVWLTKLIESHKQRQTGDKQRDRQIILVPLLTCHGPAICYLSLVYSFVIHSDHQMSTQLIKKLKCIYKNVWQIGITGARFWAFYRGRGVCRACFTLQGTFLCAYEPNWTRLACLRRSVVVETHWTFHYQRNITKHE